MVTGPSKVERPNTAFLGTLSSVATTGAAVEFGSYPLVNPETEAAVDKWEYRVVPLESAANLKKRSDDLTPDRLNELGAQGWEAVGLTLKRGDLVAWPVVLLKRPIE